MLERTKTLRYTNFVKNLDSVFLFIVAMEISMPQKICYIHLQSKNNFVAKISFGCESGKMAKRPIVKDGYGSEKNVSRYLKFLHTK